jgi:GTP-binding protein
MIVDQAKIYLKAGKGGEGCFSTTKISARKTIGSGGDGGNGGNIILKVESHPYDLSKFKGKKKFVAEDGKRGAYNNKKGKNGQDVILGIPEGTIVRDLEGNIITDLVGNNKEFLVCRGGKGGEGNNHRDYVLPPHSGEEKEIILDYRIPADVAIVGFANSGKTSLFNKLTGKVFKVAEYAFTTTSCVWAKSRHGFREFTILDMPAVKKKTNTFAIEHSFLKHLYRTKVILLLSENYYECYQDFFDLEEIIRNHDKSILEGKKLFYLLTKIDKIDKTIVLDDVIGVSVETGVGIEQLQRSILSSLNLPI